MNPSDGDDQRRYVLSTEVYSQTLAGEAVLLDVASGMYFGLDEVGTRIWELLQGGQTLGAIAATLAGEYDADLLALERDTQSFVDGLVARGLVQVAPDVTEIEPHSDEATTSTAPVQSTL